MRYLNMLAAVLYVGSGACDGIKPNFSSVASVTSAAAVPAAVSVALAAKATASSATRAAVPAVDVPASAPDVSAIIARTYAHANAHVGVDVEGDPGSSFDLALPKDWRRRPVGGDARQAHSPARVLARFAPEPTSQGAPVVTVTLTPMPVDIALDGWALAQFEREGYSLVARRWFPGPNGLFFDITGKRGEGDREVVRRTSLRADGTRIFALDTVAPIGLWDANKHKFWAAHATFELLHPMRGEPEPLRTSATNGPMLRVEHPVSWQPEPVGSNDPNVSGLHLRLSAPDGEHLGADLMVRAERGREQGIDELVRQGTTMLSGAGFVLQAPLRPIPVADDPRRVGVRGWVAGFQAAARSARAGSEPYLVRIEVIQRAGSAVTLVLCHPQSKRVLLTALRAQRVLERVRASLDVLDAYGMPGVGAQASAVRRE